MDLSGKLSLRPVWFKQWGDEYLIYNELTADTHLFDSVMGELIISLSNKPFSKQEFLDSLLISYTGFSEKDVAEYMENVIQILQEKDLLEIGL